MPSYSRGVLTMAYGSDRFIEMARSLAQSLIVHSPQTPRAIVTDSSDRELRALFDVCVPLNRGFGSGLRQKLYLDKYTPFNETIFIDSDCLAVRSLDHVWDYFKSVPFGIPGDVKLRRGDQDPKMDVDYILNYYDLQEVSKFNSGLIYFDSSESSVLIFETARELLSRYQELRFSAADDEPIFAVSMALHGRSAIPDDGRTMRTPAGLRGELKIDVLRGVGIFNKHGLVVEPAIVHFAGNYSKSFEYRRECYRLHRLKKSSHYPNQVALAWLWLLAWFSSQLDNIRRIGIRSRASLVKKHLISALELSLKISGTRGRR